jgi:probable HAF family extracellular repeat protein
MPATQITPRAQASIRTRGLFATALVALALSPTVEAGTATFQGLGDLPGGLVDSRVGAVSADGAVVAARSVSASGTEAVIWTAGNGLVAIGDLDGGSVFASSTALSADATVIVGLSTSAAGFEAFRWTAGDGMVGLGDLPDGNFDSLAQGTSADGSIVVGRGTAASGPHAFRWTAAEGMIGLAPLPGGQFSGASAITPDGSLIVGWSATASGQEAVYWSAAEDVVSLGDLFGSDGFAAAHAVSSDGSFIVGGGSSASGDLSEAFRWSAAEGMVGLGNLIATAGESIGSVARAVSGDGSIVVGQAAANEGSQAFIWDSARGMRSLKHVLVNDFGLDLADWVLLSAEGLSADGLTVVGNGLNPDGRREAWIVTLPADLSSAGACCEGGVCTQVSGASACVPPRCNATTNELADCGGACGTTCYGDVDGNGVVNAGDRGFISASIGLTSFAAVCQYDLDGNGVINAADRGFVSAAIGSCDALPDWQNGSGLNHGEPDSRFGSGVFMGADSSCDFVVCP